MLGVSDFARGNAQPIDIPAAASGLPIRISDGTGIESIAFTLRWRHDAAAPTTDPMVVSAIELAPGLPTEASLSYDLTDPSAISVTVALPAGMTFGAGPRALVIVRATVGTDAVYGAKQVLDIDAIAVNGTSGGAIDDDGVQVVALLGDTSGNRDYSTLDVQRLQRVIVRHDSGFGAFPNADPLIIGDIAAPGALSAVDATRLLQEVNYVVGGLATDRPEIPPIPAGVTPLPFVGPDPQVDLPRDLLARPGDTIVVPLQLDTAEGLESARVRIVWDAGVLELLEVRRGSVSADFNWFVQRRAAGELLVDMSRLHALSGGSGSLLELQFRVAPQAKPGTVALDLAWVSLNEGRLTLSPLPQAGPDPTDGVLTIEAQPAPLLTQPAPASASGILRILVAAFTRKLPDVATRTDLSVVAVSIPPLGVESAAATVQEPPRIDLSGGPDYDWTASAGQDRDWLRAFISGDKPQRPQAATALKIVLPRVAPQLVASGGVTPETFRR